jgi:acyl phosphate:glycerol-3-phosphate acyltransferase
MLLASFLIVAMAYLLGSIPVGYLLVKFFRHEDIRSVGSGNIGATNVLRSGGKGLGAATFALDVIKGAAAVALGAWMASILQPALPFRDAEAIAAVSAVLGHMFPVWLRFRGGKGVATACGVFSVLTPLAVPPALAIFIATVWATKYISLGSVVASVSLPAIAYLSAASSPVVIAACGASALIVMRHRTNLWRVRAGTERRLGVRA